MNAIHKGAMFPVPKMITAVPHVIQQTAHGERGYDIFSKILEDRVVMLCDEVTSDTAQLIIAQLLYLESVDDSTDITLYINSPGGSVSDGLAIYDTMNYIKPDVSTVCVGCAASMGALLLSGGAKGKRYVLPNAEVMIHQPLGGCQGQVTNMQITMDRLSRLKETLARYLAEHTGQSYEKVLADTERDNWMTAKEAVEYGLVDKIIANR